MTNILEKKITIGVGILTMGQPQNLDNILKSYYKYKLFNEVDQIVIMLQCNIQEEKEIVKKYNIPYIYTNENIGIGPANNLIVDKLNTDYIIILQNDFELISNDFINEIHNPIQMMEKEEIDCYRLRNMSNPGYPAYGCRNININLTHLCCLFYYDYYFSKEVQQNDKITYLNSFITKSNSKYILSSKNACYTENPCIFKKSFYLKYLYSLSNINYKKSERNIQQLWEKLPFKVGIGKGLFTHNDLQK